MFQPVFLMDVLSGLGAGQRVMVLATLVLAVLYLVKSKKAAGAVVNTMSTVWLVGVSVATAAVLAFGLGWANPDVNAFVSDVAAFMEFAWDVAKEPAKDAIGRVIDWAT